MDDFEKENAGNDLEVEITDLDAPDKAQKTPVTADNIRRPHLPPQARVGMSLLTIAGVGVLLLLILVDVLHVHRQAANPAVSASVVPLDNLVSVFVADGVAFVGSQEGTTYALRASNGSLLWRSQTAGQVVGTDDGNVYVSSPLDMLYALRASDGSLLWRHAAFFHAVNCQGGGVVSVGLQDGTVDVLRARDGSLLWSYKTSFSPFLLPVVVEGVAYIAPQDGGIEAVRASDGSLLWHSQAGQA